jgi:hypothetical protein
MRKTIYSFSNLRRHSKDIRLKTTRLLRERTVKIDQAFYQFDAFFTDLEGQPKSLIRNVRMMLACQMLNHVYSSLILAEHGMIVDAWLCERNALETMAFHWLVCADPKAAEEFEKDEIPKPIEVRKRLEQLGIDISYLKDFYASGSKISHVGRESERFNSQWESPLKGELLLGGKFSPEDQTELFRWLPLLLNWFVDHEIH